MDYDEFRHALYRKADGALPIDRGEYIHSGLNQEAWRLDDRLVTLRQRDRGSSVLMRQRDHDNAREAIVVQLGEAGANIAADFIAATFVDLA